MASNTQHIDVLLSQLNFRDKNRVKADFIGLERDFKALIPRTGVLARNDGTIENVLVLGGTIPIIFGGVQYNIPLDLFVLENYPQQAPEIYIRPTANMMIKSNHKNVDMQGLVYLPYLHAWSLASSLVQLCHTASAAFSKEPPLFSKPAASQPVPPPRPSPMASMYASGANQQQQQQQKEQQRLLQFQKEQQQKEQQQKDQLLQQQQQKEQMNKRGKDVLISQITSRLQEEILMAQTRMKSEIEQEFRTSQELKQSEEDIDKYHAELLAVKEKMTAELAAVARQDEQLETWRATKEKTQLTLTSEEASQQLLGRLKPYDELSEQLVKLQSEHNAIDDAMYHLEKALQRGHHPSLTLELFLSKTRELASKQFLCRAHIRKIEAKVSSALASSG